MSAIHPSTKRRGVVVALSAGLLAATLPGAASATAGPAVAAICSASIPLHLSPGLSLLTQNSGTNQSFGETGTLGCAGKVDGLRVTGTGTIGFRGNYAGTCSAASGGGTWSFSLPVDDNGTARVIHHSGTYNAPNVGLAITFNGQFETGKLSGLGLVVPGTGNCLTQPLSTATLPMVGVQLTQ
ncbi:MAG: hypothetical protein DLM58_00290 [Pseudonocardiales bacterium]|nr:MAG: hypothetical protein DLM58_00290 [Pseudonocardiales bacterium]